MRRVGYLIEKIADLDNLYAAYVKARRGKQTSPDVIAFGKSLSANLSRMQSEIRSGEVTVGNYTYFTISDPKVRTICAASFYERVLHHAIMNVCHQYFERTLTDDTYATRPNRGIYSALDKAQKGCRKYRYYAKLDVRKYFDSINHTILKNKLCRIFKDPVLLQIFNRIIDSYSVTDDCGLPIGNLTSQYFANFYLSSADHLVKEYLKIPVYVRYMDDMLLFGDDVKDLKIKVDLVTTALSEIGLQQKQPVINPSHRGVCFLGYKTYPYVRLLEKRSKQRFARKMKSYARNLKTELWNQQYFAEHITPLLAFTLKASSKNFRTSVMQRLAIEGL